MDKHGIRFRSIGNPKVLRLIRILLLCVATIAVVLGTWMRTYSIRGYYSNGKIAWEQFENRTVFMNVDVSKRVTWYPSGTISGVWTPTEVTYYSPSGEAFPGNDRQAARMWATRYSSLLLEDTVMNVGERPFQSLLSWFNKKLPKVKTTP